MTFGKRICQTVGVLALGALVSTGAIAQVSARFVVPGTALTTAKIAPGGAFSMEVRIDAPAPAQNTIGATYFLQQIAPVAPPGYFTITNRVDTGDTPPANPLYPYNDQASGQTNATVLALPSAFLNPSNGSNLGRNNSNINVGIPPASNILATTLTLTSDPATPLGTYTISAKGGGSSTITTTDGAGNFTDFPLTASFTIVVGQTLTVTKSGTGGGVVADTAGSAINCGAVCSDIVAGSATLTATPNPGSVFTQWTTGPCAGTNTSPCVVPVAAATTVNAQFDIGPQTLTVALAGAGAPGSTVTSVVAPPINCPGTCMQTYPAGTVVVLTANPAAGASFTGWSGAVPACPGTGTCSVTMNQAQNVTATFLPPQTLQVTLAGTGTGTVTSVPAGISCPATCSSVFPVNQVVTLTAVNSAGSVFTGWSGAGCAGLGTCVVTMSASQSVTATFMLPPTTAITGEPPNPSTVAAAQFTFTSSLAGSTFLCQLDGGALFLCSPPLNLIVGNGTHTFKVAADGPGNNLDPIGASYTWTVSGLVAPVVTGVIPTLSEWMLLLLALILGTAGILASRRKN
jgi:Divergent InlB B-repeat domain